MISINYHATNTETPLPLDRDYEKGLRLTSTSSELVNWFKQWY